VGFVMTFFIKLMNLKWTNNVGSFEGVYYRPMSHEKIHIRDLVSPLTQNLN